MDKPCDTCIVGANCSNRNCYDYFTWMEITSREHAKIMQERQDKRNCELMNRISDEESM